MVEVAYLDITKLGVKEYGIMRSVLSESRLLKADSYLSEEDGKLSVAAAYLLDCTLSEFGLRERDIEVVKNEFGKPYIRGNGLYFNLSHSGNISVCALSDCEVGVDIEEIKEVEDKLIRRVCTDKEYEFLSAKEDKLGQFFRVWTVKESVIKYLGTGLSTPLKSIETDLTRSLEVKIDGKETGLRLQEYALKGYCVTACNKFGGFSKELKEVKVNA